jgi:hypothetical protein
MGTFSQHCRIQSTPRLFIATLNQWLSNNHHRYATEIRYTHDVHGVPVQVTITSDIFPYVNEPHPADILFGFNPSPPETETLHLTGVYVSKREDKATATVIPIPILEFRATAVSPQWISVDSVLKEAFEDLYVGAWQAIANNYPNDVSLQALNLPGTSLFPSLPTANGLIPHDSAEPAPAPEAPATSSNESTLLEKSLIQLRNDGYKISFARYADWEEEARLRFELNLTIKEIAERKGISADKVKKDFADMRKYDCIQKSP